MRSTERPEIEFEVACDVIESLHFAKIYGFCDVTSNFEVDFRAIGCLNQGATFDFSSSFFELFLMAISIKIGHAPVTPNNLCLNVLVGHTLMSGGIIPGIW